MKKRKRSNVAYAPPMAEMLSFASEDIMTASGEIPEEELGDNLGEWDYEKGAKQ